MKILVIMGYIWIAAILSIGIAVIITEVWDKLFSGRKNISESEFEEFIKQSHEEFMEFINDSIETINALDEGRDKDHLKMSKTESGLN